MTTKLKKWILEDEDEYDCEEYDEKDSEWDEDDDEEVELKPMTPQERVISLLKGGFENRCGISFDEFIQVYNELLEHNPEKLI